MAPVLVSSIDDADDNSSDDEADEDDTDSFDDREPLPPLISDSGDNVNDADSSVVSNEYVSPYLTPFTNGFGQALNFIVAENAQCSVPYQEARLVISARCH